MSARVFSVPGDALRRYALLFAGVAGLSMAGVYYKLASAPVVTIVAYRMLLATALAAPLALLAGRMRVVQSAARFRPSDVAASAASGCLFAVDLLLWAASLRYTTVASAALFVSTHPIFVALLAALIFGERPTILLAGGIALGVLGIAIVGAGDLRIGAAAIAGDALALAAALAETGYLLFGRHVRRRVDAPRYVTVVYAAAAVCIWLALLAGRVSPALNAHDLLVCLALAAIVTVFGHTLVSQSLGSMPAAVVAVAFLAQPLLAALFALAIVGQAIPAATVAGGLVALAGIGLVSYANERKPLLQA